MLNSVVLMGRLTAAPDYRRTSNDVPYARFTLAVGRNFSKSAEDKTDFIDIVTWRHTADFVDKYFKKGQLVAVEGSIQVDSYQDKDGNKRKSFVVSASQVHFAEGKRDSYDQGYDNSNDQSYQPSKSFENGSAEDFQEIETDDDLPF